MSDVDYDVRGRVEAGSRAQLADLLRSLAQGPVRLVGAGTAQNRLPAPGEPVTLVSLAPMHRIVRLEADDLTCSVEPGLRREDLDQALAEKGLRLPCAGTGTLGGMLAEGRHGPVSPGAMSARSLLLGLEGLLAEGLPFKCGARVVKSVAGYDVHKLFVGSRGRLFAATLLHLKLRPLPRASVALVSGTEPREGALRLLLQLRAQATPPARLVLVGRGAQARVHATVEGGVRFVAEQTRLLGLATAPHAGPLHVEPRAGEEVLAGLVRPSRGAELLRLLPPAAGFVLDGAGRFEAALAPADSDALLAALPRLEAAGEIQIGARERRGRATPSDATANGLRERIKQQLDPGGMLR